jgi:hypothetical protein
LITKPDLENGEGMNNPTEAISFAEENAFRTLMGVPGNAIGTPG